MQSVEGGQYCVTVGLTGQPGGKDGGAQGKSCYLQAVFQSGSESLKSFK